MNFFLQQKSKKQKKSKGQQPLPENDFPQDGYGEILVQVQTIPNDDSAETNASSELNEPVLRVLQPKVFSFSSSKSHFLPRYHDQYSIILEVELQNSEAIVSTN